MSDEDEPEDTAPLQDLRPFYRSRPREPLTFVRASTAEPSTTVQPPNRAAEAYLSIVLKNTTPSDSPGSLQDLPDARDLPSSKEVSIQTCNICKLPITSSASGAHHEASIAHQVCLTHSHPPSHLDRTHVGLRYLSSHGWDPDSRKGLGAEGHGIRAPIKAVTKNNTAGIGIAVKKAKEASPVRKETLDAGKVRKQVAQDKRKEAKLRDLFYGDDKIAKYLGHEH